MKPRILSAIVMIFGMTGSAISAPLPYTQRTQGYTAFGGAVSGSLQYVGLAGATTGLAHTIDGSFANPAGLAMTLGQSGITISRNTVSDAFIQSEAEPTIWGSGLFAAPRYPYGFSFGFNTVFAEGRSYDVGGTPVRFENSTREFRLSGARILADDRISLGLGVVMGDHSLNAMVPSDSTLSRYHSTLSIGGTIGALYQAPQRIFGGVAVTTPLSYPGGIAADIPDSASTEMRTLIPSFLGQPAHSPWRLSFGVGWIPNRIFQAGAVLNATGPHAGAALLGDQNRAVGGAWTLQPRFGLSYLLMDYSEIGAEVALGGYWEGTRVEGTQGRAHATVSILFRPWIFYFGWGTDVAWGYRNTVIAGGVNVLRVFEKLDLLPRSWRPPSVGFFPNPFHLSDSGLPRPLVKDWRPPPNAIDLLKEAPKIPRRLERKILDTPKNIEKFGQGVVDSVDNAIQNRLREQGGSKKSPLNQKKKKR